MLIVYARATMRHKLLIAAFFACLAACAPKLGDGCKRDTDCSVNRDRTCDLAQPGGYCTIADCVPGSCGDEGVCVRWQPAEPRLARAWCMASCGNTGDCDRDRYVCRSADQLNEALEDPARDDGAGAARVAEVLDDDKNDKFCVVKSED
jgi:hypothetical protein